MATNYLDTGDTGRAVSAESDGALFAGIFGSAKYVWTLFATRAIFTPVS